MSVAKAMNRERVAKNTKELFHLQKKAALKSIQTGLYIGWRCPGYLWDCFRAGDESTCFCGHLLKPHQVNVEKQATVPCTVAGCRCLHALRRWVSSGFGEERALTWQPGE